MAGSRLRVLDAVRIGTSELSGTFFVCAVNAPAESDGRAAYGFRLQLLRDCVRIVKIIFMPGQILNPLQFYFLPLF
jgi:hypothetical protein